MSVDLEATLPDVVRLDVLVAQAERFLGELLALPGGPVIAVFGGREYLEGRRVRDGRRSTSGELAAVVVGPGSRERSGGAVEFEVGDGGTALVWMTVMEDEPDYALFSPRRTCEGVVLATSLALAAAWCSGGEFRDEEIGMLVPPVTDPTRVVERTRLADPGGDFGDRCEQYLRQFHRLNGWPARG